MHTFKRGCALFLFLVPGMQASHAGLGDWLDTLKPPSGEQQASGTGGAALDALTQTDMVKALKQALHDGVQHAVDQLGQPGGYLDDARVHIPMPEQLAWSEKTLRSFGQDALADEFVQSMNRAAERAVPEVAAVFGEAIKSMSLDDARRILEGPDDAATRYFQTHSSETLAARLRPIISEATDSAGATAYYKTMMNKAGGFSSLLAPQTVDLDGYVTQKAMDGLFLMIAEQEQAIRENPLERSTDLLQQVFGALGGSN